VLKWRKSPAVILSLSFILMLSSCRNTDLLWHEKNLIAQLYIQPRQEILLAYNDLANGVRVDQQYGYARAYFDNYRKQIIFSAQGTVDYMIAGRQFTTATDEISGYVSEVLVNDMYQLGVEIIDITDGTMGKGQFWGAKSRIIDLNSNENIILDGLLFNRNMIAGHYFYGFTFDKTENQFLDIIDLRTMEHRRFDTTASDIRFLYRSGDNVYGQSETNKTAFLFTELEMKERKEMYNDNLAIEETEWYILKDVAPSKSEEHWYIASVREDGVVKGARLLKVSSNDVKVSFINFERDDIVRIKDTANFGENKVAIFLSAKDDEGKVHAIIEVFDLAGNKIGKKEITEIRGDIGRFTYLDYLE
jgi:hypothetical protein